MIDDELVRAHRARALNPEHPFIRGTAQNPDTFFQARETVNPFYASCPDIVQSAMDHFAKLTGRHYHLFDYDGPAGCRARPHPDGLGRRDRARDGRGAPRRGRKGRRAAGAAVSSLFGRAFSRGAAQAPAARSPCSSRPRSRAPGEPLYLDVIDDARRRPSRGASAGPCRWSSAAATGCRRRISTRPWPRRCSTS